jgi:hypothetical protein
MSLTSYRAAPPRVREFQARGDWAKRLFYEEEGYPFFAGLATTYSPMS